MMADKEAASASQAAARKTSARQPREQTDRSFISQILLFYGIGVIFVLAGYLVAYSYQFLLLLFASILIGIVLYDGSRKLETKLHIPHYAAFHLLQFVLIIIAGLVGWLIAPQIAEQTQQLLKAIPNAIVRFESYLQQLTWFNQLLGGMPSFDDLIHNATGMLSKAGVLFSGTIGVIGNAVIIVFVAIYLAAQPQVYVNGFVTLFPLKKRARTREVMDELGDTLAQWMLGKLLSMVIIAAATALGLWLLGVPLALVLGVIAGLLDFIPYIGPIMAAVPAILLALSDSPTLALYVTLLFIGVQILEGYIVLPLIERKTVSLPPALTIAMQVLLGSLFGLSGIALATPLAAVITVLVVMLYVQDVLGDPVRTPAEHSE
jgi:predicted PurR-regulated permease PerM